MTTQEWAVDAAKVLTEALKQPVFPGDPDPVADVVKKIINKAIGECNNGGKYGADGCVACRAYRTERAEDRLKVAVNDLDNLTRELDKESAMKQALKIQLESAIDALKDAGEYAANKEVEVNDLEEATRIANVENAAAQQAVKVVSVERDNLQREINVKSELLSKALARIAAFEVAREKLDEV
jgi:hypothetical protein